MDTRIVDSVVYHDTKRQLAALLKEQKRRRGLTDLHFLCKHVLGYHDLTDASGFHGEYCRHLENPKRRFKLSLTPRGSLKTSIGTIGQSIQDIIKNPNIRILLASEKFTIATKILSEIKGHIEKNPEFISLYGNIKGPDKWTESEIIVKTRTNWKASPTIACAGIDVTKVGMHYDIIRVDDPHSDQNTTSQDQIDKVIRWYKLLFSLLDPGGYLYITGTIWHYGDLYNYIINKERERLQAKRKARFAIYQRDSFQGTIEDLLNDKITKDKLLWPERLSAAFLKDTLIEQGPYIFNCQYRLQPTDDETAVFKRSWFKTCEPDDVPSNLSIFSTIDPMRDEEGSDYLAIITCGYDREWKQYLLDVRRLKADEHDTVEELFDVYKKFKPQKMGFETVAWQKTYYKYVQMLQLMKGRKLPIVQLKTDTRVTKRMRIKGMVPYIKTGLFIIPVYGGIDNVTGNVASLVDELTRFPKISHDDCIDALAYQNQVSKRPGVLNILAKINPKSFTAVRAKLVDKNKVKLGSRNVRDIAHA